MILFYVPNPNDHNYVSQFLNELNILISHTNTYYIIGDLNLPNMNWVQLTSNTTLKENRIAEFLINNQPMKQIITFPTRKHNLIDVILTNSPNSVLNLEPSPCIVEQSFTIF